MYIKNIFLYCRTSLAGISAVILLGYSHSIPALDLGYEDWQLNGFASQGYTLTSGYNFYGHSRTGGSLDFTEIGVNVLGHIHPNVLIAAQGLYRNAGGSDQEDFRLDYANLDWHLTIGDRSMAGIRLGRVKNPFGLYNDTRDMAWTRPGVFVPQSVYFDSLALRQPMISSDGGLLYGRYAFGDHAITTELVISDPLDNSGGAIQFLTGIPNVNGRMEGRPLLVGRMGYQWLEGRFRLLFSVVDLDRNFDSSTPGVPSGNVKAFYPLASAQLNLEDWTLTAEYGQVNTNRSGFTPGEIAAENTSESFYVQAQYRFRQNWSTLLRYDSFTVNIDDRDGRQSAALTGLPRHNFYARDLTVGLRWEISRDWLLMSEYHSVWGTAWVSPLDNPGLRQSTGPDRWDIFALMLSFRF